MGLEMKGRGRGRPSVPVSADVATRVVAVVASHGAVKNMLKSLRDVESAPTIGGVAWQRKLGHDELYATETRSRPMVRVATAT